MKKKIIGLFFITTLALTLSTTTSGASPSGNAHCWGPPPQQDCVCINGVWRCLS